MSKLRHKNSLGANFTVHVTEPQLATSVKQRQDPFSGPQRIQQIIGSSFQISFHPDWQIHKGFFKQANHGAYSNPGTQMGAQNKDFGAVLQTDLTRVLEFRLWGRLLYISLIF